MIIAMQPGAEEPEIHAVIEHLIELGFDVHRETGAERTVLACLGVRSGFDSSAILALPGVADVHRISAPYKLAARALRPQGTVVEAAGLRLGGGGLAIIAAASDPAEAARAAAAGAGALRLPLRKREEKDWRALRAACDRDHLAAVGEVLSETELPLLDRYLDVLQIGAANLQNAYLLRAVAQLGKPVLIERGPAASLEELLLAAEQVLAGGNPRVVVCERGIRTLANPVHDTLDLAAIPRLKKLSHLPVVADLSAIERDLLAPLAAAAVAAGANGLVLAAAPLPALSRSLADWERARGVPPGASARPEPDRSR